MRRADLSDADCEGMWQLFTSFFAAHDRATFMGDLATKDVIVLLRHGDQNEIRGFSTLSFYASAWRGQPIGVVYSGDTVVHPAYWGTPELPRAWIRTVLAHAGEWPSPLYWLLISSGYKSYRFLTVFFKQFFPRHDQPTPPDKQALMHHLAAERFGSAFDPATGIVRFPRGATPLRTGVADVGPDRLHDPDVAFFVHSNPRHAQGDELVCLARIDADNFTAAGRRMARP